jgi:hypothetical protein
MSDDARFDPRFDPAFQPGYDGPLAQPAPVARQRTVVSAPEALPVVQTPVAVEADLDDVPVRTGTNPFLIALGAVAFLLVGGGTYLVSRLSDMFLDTQSAVDYTILQVLMYGAPMVIVLGLAAGVGILFVLAARWYRR